MPRPFVFRTVETIADDVVVVVDREDFDHVLGAERDPFARFVLLAPLPVMDEGADWPAGSIGEAIAELTAGGVYAITSFTVIPELAERGQVVVNIALGWVIDCPAHKVLGQTITGPGSPPPLTQDDRSVLIPGPLSVDATWTLTIQTSLGNLQDTVTLAWVDKVFWGRGGSAALTEAQVEALASRLEDGFSAYDFSAGTDYWWVVAPDAYGPPAFIDGATYLPVPFSDLDAITVTNPHGQAVIYRRWRSLYPQVAAGGIEVNA